MPNIDLFNVDDEARDVVLTIHWPGGQHSQLRVRNPCTMISS
jgi:hypothetical protein